MSSPSLSSSFSSHLQLMAFEALFVLRGHNLSSSFVLEASQQDFTTTTTTPPPLNWWDSSQGHQWLWPPSLHLTHSVSNGQWALFPTDVLPSFSSTDTTLALSSQLAGWPCCLSACFSSSQLWALYHSRTHILDLSSPSIVISSKTSSSFGIKYHLFIDAQLPPKLISSPNPVEEFQTHMSAFFGPSLV